MISLRATRDRRGSLGVHLRQKQPKSVKKWLGYGYFPLRGYVILLRSSGTKGDPWVFICVKKIQHRSRNGLVTDIFPHRRCVISLRTTRDQRGSLGIHLCQKDLLRNTWVMSIFPHVILLSASWDQSRIWGVHLCHKDPKSIKKWLSYDYFSIERLCYFIEIQMGPKEILGCSFMPQRSEIGQEMAKLQLFSY